MKARKTASGITSVLIEPCRKKLRSSCDQVGTCGLPGGAGFFFAVWLSFAKQLAARIANNPAKIDNRGGIEELILIDAVFDYLPTVGLFR